MGKSLLTIRYLTFVRSQEFEWLQHIGLKYGSESASRYPGARASVPPPRANTVLVCFCSTGKFTDNSPLADFAHFMTCVQIQSRFSVVLSSSTKHYHNSWKRKWWLMRILSQSINFHDSWERGSWKLVQRDLEQLCKWLWSLLQNLFIYL